ncbi:hypothetical protein OBE_05248, partial [human gut metagenome]
SNSFVIDPLGDLYKCWDEIGIKEKSSGNVKTGFDTPNMKNGHVIILHIIQNAKNVHFFRFA